MPQQPQCPECKADVQPSWDWCLSCGYDPEGLRPLGTTITRPATTVTVVEEARPQQIIDAAWVPEPPRGRLSYLATVGVIAAILMALAGLVFVILMVLHQPVGTTRADALPFGPAGGAISARVSASAR